VRVVMQVNGRASTGWVEPPRSSDPPVPRGATIHGHRGGGRVRLPARDLSEGDCST